MLDQQNVLYDDICTVIIKASSTNTLSERAFTHTLSTSNLGGHRLITGDSGFNILPKYLVLYSGYMCRPEGCLCWTAVYFSPHLVLLGLCISLFLWGADEQSLYWVPVGVIKGFIGLHVCNGQGSHNGPASKGSCACNRVL